METSSFEAAYERLQAIVKRLESGDLPLEESLLLFEEGIGLFRECQAHLKGAEGRIARLVKNLDEEWTAVPFNI